MVRKLSWQLGSVVEVRDETPDARTLVLDVPDWSGHLAGQHLDVRLTAPDGYSTERSYSIASATAAGRVEITVQRVADGEVSPYLAGVLSVGDPLELRGPVGGWFVWRPGSEGPVQLIAGGSGVVPLMAMARTRAAARGTTPFRLLYSVRGPESVFYRDELTKLAGPGTGLELTYAYTRRTPPDWLRPAGRLDAALLAASAWPASANPRCYVCGPTPFVETAADLLVDAGHDAAAIRTERFGPTGG